MEAEEGTPPVLERYLDSLDESPSCHPYALRGLQQPEYQRPQDIVKSAVDRQYRPANAHKESSEHELDLVQMLEENWYWRPATSKPSTPEIDDTMPARKRYSLQRQHSYGTNGYRAFRANFGGNDSGPQSNKSMSPPAAQPGLRRSTSEAADSTLQRLSLDQDSEAPESEAEETPRSAKSLRNPEEVDSIGTWAQRVLRFHPSPPAEQPNVPDTPDATEIQPRQNGRRSSISRKDRAGIEDEEAAAHAAWRWRFNRRWRTEQAKQLDPDFGMSGDEDGWDEALGYLDACGPGVHLQIGRTNSNKSTDASSLRSSGGWGLLVDESQRERTLAGEDNNVTSNIASKARKVQDLYRHQLKIEKDVKAKWGSTKVSMAWAGQHLKSVSIDSHGRFPFILVKLVDSSKAHRLLVRGQHDCTVAQLLASTAAEVVEVCQRHKLPHVPVTLLGSGVMEWSRDHARKINVSQGHLERGSESIQSAEDVARLAGALTRSSLAAPNRVTVNGEKLS